MANLQAFPFTLMSDVATSTDGWTNIEGSVDALLGNDRITGQDAAIGIESKTSILNANLGDDTLYGIGEDYGILNAERSLVMMGNGNDLVRGESVAFDGILNDEMSAIYTGLGRDSIAGISEDGDGIYNIDYSLIDTGSGHDSIVGEGGMHGIHNDLSSCINTGSGNDTIQGSGDQGEGIVNEEDSLITTGLGRDLIIARGGSIEDGLDEPVYDLFNDGIISMGLGHDTLDALPLGFAGSGTVDLGANNDNLKGFGSGCFIGGRGIDVLTFNPGTYSICSYGDGTFLIGDTMTVTGFEQFGAGATIPSFAAAAAAGSVTFV